jgi:hypothetical protein
VFALLIMWQHCNTAAIFHTQSSGRHRNTSPVDTLVVKGKKRKSNSSNTTLCKNGSLQRYLFRFPRNHHQAFHTNFDLLIHAQDLHWYSGIAATELPPRVHLGLKLAGPLCAAISRVALCQATPQTAVSKERKRARNVRII